MSAFTFSQQGALVMEQENFSYYAFISYSHNDKEIAQKIQKRLEHYHMPSKLLEDHPELPKKFSPIFRGKPPHG